MPLDRYWRHVGAVFTGTVAAQIIPICGALIIARQYAPAEFGTFSAWLGIVLFLAVILTGRFETALAIVPDGEPRRHAVLATLITAMVAAAVGALLCSVAIPYIPMFENRLSPTLAILLIPTALTVALAQTWLSWAAAEGNYGYLSSMKIAQAAAITLFQITAGIFTPLATSLAFAHFCGVFAGLIFAFYLMPPGRFPNDSVKHSILTFWTKYRRFPIFSLPADSINTAAAQLPVIIVAARFGSDVAGLLAMALRIMGAPIGLLGTSVLEVFKRHAATSFRERGECSLEYLRTLRVLGVGSAVFFLAMSIASEPFFALAFGEKWLAAGTIAVWLLPLFALRFVASPLSYMFYIADKQHIDLMWQVALLVMTISALRLTHTYEDALQSYSIGYSLLYVFYLAMSYRFSLGKAR
jgi:O-antigen/teichoic acid export membrane protein